MSRYQPSPNISKPSISQVSKPSISPNHPSRHHNASFTQSANNRSNKKSSASNIIYHNPPSEQDYIPSQEETSSFSFYEYREILNNLFENGEEDQEWLRMPETFRLIAKALVMSMNKVEDKLAQNRQLINGIGLKGKETLLQLQTLKKQFQKLTLTNPNPNKPFSKSPLNNEPISPLPISQNLYSKGLDMIMIQQVKTITDAIVSKKYTDFVNQINEAQSRFQGQFREELEKVKVMSQEVVQRLETHQSEIQRKFAQGTGKVDNKIANIEMELQLIKKQLNDNHVVINQFADYAEHNYVTKSQLKSNLKSSPKHNSDPKPQQLQQQHISLSPFTVHQINQLIKEELSQNPFILKKKEFEEFKEKINRDMVKFATVEEVQRIVHKYDEGKCEVKERSQQFRVRNKMDDHKEYFVEERIQKNQKPKKKNKISEREEQRSKSPQQSKKSMKAEKDKSNQTSQSKLSTYSKSRIQPFHNKSNKLSKKSSLHGQDQTIVQSRQTRTKTTKSPNSVIREQQHHKITPFTNSPPENTNVQTQIKSLRQQINSHLGEQLSKLSHKLTKRLQLAEKEFCSVVEENWKVLSEKNLKVKKEEKENFESLLKTFSTLNVMIRCMTVVQNKANQCIRWQKESFNAMERVFTLTQDKTHIYITPPGVYHLQVVCYTVYDPVIHFAIQLNSQQIFNSSQPIALKPEKPTSPQRSNENQPVNSNTKSITHPSRGVQFSQNILIPAKSSLAIRLKEQLHGQAFIQIRKM